MPRPHTCDLQTCSLCRLYYTSERHRVAWGGPKEVPPLPAGWGEVKSVVFPVKTAGTGRLSEEQKTQIKRAAKPCIHRGKTAVRNEGCGCSVFSCSKFGECTSLPVVKMTLPVCSTCTEYKSPDQIPPEIPIEPNNLSPKSELPWVKKLFLRRPEPWPRWAYGPDPAAELVKQAFRELFDEVKISAPPTWTQDRGIVICGGGWRFFPSLFVTVRMIRDCGCSLPIQIWYLGDRGEFDPRMLEVLKAFDVSWIDANATWRDRPGVAIRRENIDHGWMLKPFAAAYSPFREVLVLDADSYPVRNPEEFLFDHEQWEKTGAVFWPDFGALEIGQYERLGVPVPEERVGLESGQFAVDKGRHWKPLWLTCWLNSFWEYVWGPSNSALYGDKDTFQLAWFKAGHEFCMPTKTPGYDTHSYLQPGFDGRTLFVHRTRDKFRWAGEFDGKPISKDYYTYQQNGDTPQRVNHLPGEYFAWRAFNHCDVLMRPDRYFQFREGTHDPHIWKEVVYDATYDTPYLGGVTVVDVGAHMGTFSWLALSRGATEVHAYEPCPDNFRMLKGLMDHSQERVFVYNEGVWAQGGEMTLVEDQDLKNTGGKSTFRSGEGVKVPIVPFYKVMDRLENDKKVLLKLDCEGAEWGILSSEDIDWNKVWMVVGEYHVGLGHVHANPGFLLSMLHARGFKVVLFRQQDHLGLFRATRL